MSTFYRMAGTVSILLLVITAPGQQRVIPTDTTVITYHELVANGSKFPYSATTGMQPVWNEGGKAIASLHFTYYRRTDIADVHNRPLLISFNGGPGSSSVWMHIAYTGPVLLNIDEEGYPVQPYGIQDNPYSILDAADMVYVNPVQTGYSRALPGEEGKADNETFFGIRSDITYLAAWYHKMLPGDQNEKDLLEVLPGRIHTAI